MPRRARSGDRFPQPARKIQLRHDGAAALLDRRDRDAAQPGELRALDSARLPRSRDEMDADDAELGQLLHHPGGPVRLRGGDEDLHCEIGLVGRCRFAELQASSPLVDPRDSRPTGVALPVDDPQALAGLQPLHLEQVMVGFVLDEGRVGREKDR
jgi:hypothetical protein